MELNYEKYLFSDVHVGYKKEMKSFMLWCENSFLLFLGLVWYEVRTKLYMVELKGFWENGQCLRAQKLFEYKSTVDENLRFIDIRDWIYL
jgi:hypothetical protein